MLYSSKNILVFLEAIFFIYVSFLAGDTLLRMCKIRLSSVVQQIAYPIMLGFGALAYIGFLFGIIGIFYPMPLWLAVFAIFLASIKTIASHIKKIAHTWALWAQREEFSRRIFRENGFLKAIIFLWIFANLFIVFVPLTGHDTLNYHFPIMMDIYARGRIDLLSPIGSYDYMPVFAEILYTAPIALFRNTTAPFVFQVLQYSTLVLILAVIYDFFAKHIKNRFLVPTLLLFILSISDFLREVMHGGYVDTFVYLFGMTSVLIVIERAYEKNLNMRTLLLSPIFLGIALAMKYLALFFGAIIVLILAIEFFRKSMNARALLKILAGYVFLPLVIAGFWYAKNLAIFGNPVYPMFSIPQAGTDIGGFIMTRTIPHFFSFPFVRFGKWFFSNKETSSRLIVLTYFVFTYLLLGFFLIMRKKITRLAAYVFIFIESYLAFLFLISHQIRFLLPAVIMVSVLLTLLFDALYTYFKTILSERKYRLLMRITATGLNLLFLLIFLGNFHYFYVKYNYLIGRLSREEYIETIGGQ